MNLQNTGTVPDQGQKEEVHTVTADLPEAEKEILTGQRDDASPNKYFQIN